MRRSPFRSRLDALTVAWSRAWTTYACSPHPGAGLLAHEFDETFIRLRHADLSELVDQLGPLRDRAIVPLYSASVPDKLTVLYGERVVPILRALGGRGNALGKDIERAGSAYDRSAVASVVMVLAVLFEAAALSNLTALALAMMRAVSDHSNRPATGF